MTVSRFRGFESRADLGMRPPRSISRNVAAERGGVALHHGGADTPTTDHASCRRTWLAWLRFHVEVRGWADLAYTLGVCQHGVVLAGRGAGVRTAANGTNDGNLRYYAIVWVGGSRQTPTVEALEGISWAIAELRRLGAGTRVVGHTDLKSTGCPHPRILQLAREHDRRPIPTGTTAPTEEVDEMVLKRGAKGRAVALFQRALQAEEAGQGHPDPLPRFGADGDYGDETVEAVKRYQRGAQVPETGEIDGVTAALLVRYVD